MRSNNHILKPLLSLGLNYMRWTQLTPMLMMWGAALAMLLALTFVNFQEQTFSVLEAIMHWLTQLPIVGGRITQLLADEGSEIHMSTSDFKSFVLRTWSISSLAFMLASMSLAALFGPFRPWTLKRKLLFIFLGILVLLAGFVFNYFAGSENFNGDASAWIFNFSMIALLVFSVSAYCLSISHFLRFLDDALFRIESEYLCRVFTHGLYQTRQGDALAVHAIVVHHLEHRLHRGHTKARLKDIA